MFRVHTTEVPPVQHAEITADCLRNLVGCLGLNTCNASALSLSYSSSPSGEIQWQKRAFLIFPVLLGHPPGLHTCGHWLHTEPRRRGVLYVSLKRILPFLPRFTSGFFLDLHPRVKSRRKNSIPAGKSLVTSLGLAL